MSTGADVVVQVRFDRESIEAVKQMTQAAIMAAIERVKARLSAYAMSGQSNVPVRTGRLRASFDVASTPRSLVFKWSAIDPKSGYDYAKIQDVGGVTGTGGAIEGKDFSRHCREYAREWLREELLNALAGMVAP